MNNLKNGLTELMRAAVATSYGGPEVIKIIELPLPVLKARMVMVRVEASAVNSADARTRGLQVEEPMKTLMRLILGFRRPRNPILGTVYSGTVVALGECVTEFKVGDKVFGSTHGMSFGCHAEYVAVDQNSAITIVPGRKSLEEIVSLVFGGATALYFFEKSGAAPERNVLIYGASGAVGSMAVQIARNLGMRVTGVASSKNEELVISLGAERFLDYTDNAFQLPRAKYDIVFDAVGKLSAKMAGQSLRKGGVYTTVGGASVSKETKYHLEHLLYWYLSGDLKPVIQECFAFDDIQKAHALVDTGHKIGNATLLINTGE